MNGNTTHFTVNLDPHEDFKDFKIIDFVVYDHLLAVKFFLDDVECSGTININNIHGATVLELN